MPKRSKKARDVNQMAKAVMDRIAELAGPQQPPARIHGDLWSGNVLWAADGQAWLIDASSAHVGHRRRPKVLRPFAVALESPKASAGRR